MFVTQAQYFYQNQFLSVSQPSFYVSSFPIKQGPFSLASRVFTVHRLCFLSPLSYTQFFRHAEEDSPTSDNRHKDSDFCASLYDISSFFLPSLYKQLIPLCFNLIYVVIKLIVHKCVSSSLHLLNSSRTEIIPSSFLCS